MLPRRQKPKRTRGAEFLLCLGRQGLRLRQWFHRAQHYGRASGCYSGLWDTVFPSCPSLDPVPRERSTRSSAWPLYALFWRTQLQNSFFVHSSYYGLSQVWGVKPALLLLGAISWAETVPKPESPTGHEGARNSTGLWPNSTPSSTSCGMRQIRSSSPKREFPEWAEMRIEPKALEILVSHHGACPNQVLKYVCVGPGVKKEPSISTLITKVTWAPLFLVIFKTPPGTLAISLLSQVLCRFPIALLNCGKYEEEKGQADKGSMSNLLLTDDSHHQVSPDLQIPSSKVGIICIWPGL